MIDIKLAQKEDFDFFYKVKCESSNMFWTGYDTIPPKENIWRFYNKHLNEIDNYDKKKIYIIWLNNTDRVGYIYIEPQNDFCDIPIALSSDFSGHGYAKLALLKAFDLAKKIGFIGMVGHIREDNIASLNLFRKCGVTISDKYIIKELYSSKTKVKMFTVYKIF